MCIPKKHTIYLNFLHNNVWYKVSAIENDRSVYHLYKVLENGGVEFLGKGNSPTKLEDKVRSGKY